MPNYTESATMPAPDGTRFAPDAFAGVIGSSVPMEEHYPGCTATLASAVVADDGTSAIVTFEFDDATWNEMARRDVHTVLDRFNPRRKETTQP